MLYGAPLGRFSFPGWIRGNPFRLDTGAITPERIAISIVVETVTVRRGDEGKQIERLKNVR